MGDDVRAAYDAMAELYAAVNLGDLGRVATDLEWLAAFAEIAATLDGTVADLGCGPGHVVDHLTGLGLATVGYDLSPGQLAEARAAFPDSEFHLGDLTALDIADSSLSGVVSRYSIIHMLPNRLGRAFHEWFRVLEPDAPVLISFFASSSAAPHGTPFDHKVVTVYELFPATIVGLLEEAGFDRIEVGMRGPIEGQRPLDHGTVLARKPKPDAAPG